jgi:hypothetical protein
VFVLEAASIKIDARHDTHYHRAPVQRLRVEQRLGNLLYCLERRSPILQLLENTNLRIEWHIGLLKNPLLLDCTKWIEEATAMSSLRPVIGAFLWSLTTVANTPPVCKKPCWRPIIIEVALFPQLQTIESLDGNAIRCPVITREASPRKSKQPFKATRSFRFAALLGGTLDIVHAR